MNRAPADIFSISVTSWKTDTAPISSPSRKMGALSAMTDRAPICWGRPVSASPVRRTFTNPEFGTMERRLFPRAFPFSTPSRRAAASLNTRIVPSRSMAITPLVIESRSRSRNAMSCPGIRTPSRQDDLFYANRSGPRCGRKARP